MCYLIEDDGSHFINTAQRSQRGELPQLQDQPELHSGLEAILDYRVRLWQQQQQKHRSECGVQVWNHSIQDAKAGNQEK